MNKVNPLPAFTASFRFISLSSIFIAFEKILLTNPNKLSLAQGIARYVSAILPQLPKQEPRDPAD